MKLEEIKAALRAAMDEGTDDEKKAAKDAYCAAFGDPDGDGDAPASKKEAKTSEGPPPAKQETKTSEEPPPAAEGDKKETKAAARVAAELAAQVQDLAEWKAAREKREEEEERATLLSSKAIAPELRKVLEKKDKEGAFVTPLEQVRDIVGALPEKGASTRTVATTRGATRGAGQGGPDGSFRTTRMSSRADELDEKMGFKAAEDPIRREGTDLVLGVMTPSQARARIAAGRKASGTEVK
jgi:hypothetical protein